MIKKEYLNIKWDNLSNLTSESIVSFLPKIGIDIENLEGKNIMSVWEGIPFLANFLSKVWASVIAVDPLYANAPSDIYKRRSCIREISTNEIRSAFNKNDLNVEQIIKLKNVIDKWREYFIKNLFGDEKIQFNDSVAENIVNVDDHSQDFVIIAFLLNNLEREENVLSSVIESINKLKKWWKLIIIWPHESRLTWLELPTLKKRYNSQEYVYDDGKSQYKACSFQK